MFSRILGICLVWFASGASLMKGFEGVTSKEVYGFWFVLGGMMAMFLGAYLLVVHRNLHKK